MRMIRTLVMSATLCALASTLGAEQASAQRMPGLNRPSQAPPASATAQPEAPKEEAPKDERVFGAGTFDLSVGIGGVWYPHIEPGLDIGIIPLPASTTISLGATLDVGYCVGCLILGALASLSPDYDWTIRSWYVAPSVRALVHFGIIGEILRLPELDLYAGLMAGPAMYYFGVRLEDRHSNADVTVSEQVYTFFGGPVFGARYLLGDTLFAFLETRYLISSSVSSGAASINGDRVPISYNDYLGSRYGTDYTFGVGARF